MIEEDGWTGRMLRACVKIELKGKLTRFIFLHAVVNVNDMATTV